MLEIRGLRHEYAGRTVLSVPAWDVAQGDSSLVLGPSGSGKTTLLNVIAGLATPTAGTVRVAGEEITRLSAAARDAFRARKVGLVLQTLHLISVISVREDLRLAQRLAGAAVDDARIDEVLASLAISPLAGARARDISVGEAQRVAIARAAVTPPGAHPRRRAHLRARRRQLREGPGAPARPGGGLRRHAPGGHARQPRPGTLRGATPRLSML